MDIRVIVFGMCFVLIALFIVAGRYIPKAKKRSLKEAEFSLAAQSFLKDPSQATYQTCKEAAKEYLLTVNSSESLEDFLAKEKLTFP